MTSDQRLCEEIQNFFGDFVINVSDLQKPTYIFVRDFYARVLLEFEVDTDNLRKASHLIAGNDTVEIAGDLNLVNAVNKTFNFLKFGLFDLLNPGENTKRTVSMISAVMDFMNMADDLTSKLDFGTYTNSKEQLIQQAEKVEVMRQELSEIALSKDQLVQAKISMQNELAKMKMNEQEICSDATATAKEAHAAKVKMEERRDILMAKKAEAEKLRSSIDRLKDELEKTQSLDCKEEEKRKVEKEKTELHDKYLVKVAARKKYASTLDLIKPFTAVTEGVCELFVDIGERQEALLSLQKETADLKQTISTKKKEQSGFENKAEDLKNKLEQLNLEKINIKKELTKNIDDLAKKSPELVESIRKWGEEIALHDQTLDALKKDSDRAQQSLLSFVEALKKEIKMSC